MNNDSLFETIIGVVVACVAIAFTVFSLGTNDAEPDGGYYRLSAHFNKVNGINRGSDVRVAGVKVGRVTTLDLDPVTYVARVTINISNTIRIPVDSVAKIASDGLLGGAYLSVEPGVEDDVLPPGGQITFTRGSIDLLTLLAQFAGSAGSGDQ